MFGIKSLLNVQPFFFPPIIKIEFFFLSFLIEKSVEFGFVDLESLITVSFEFTLTI